MKKQWDMKKISRTVISLFLLLIFASSLVLVILAPLGKIAVSEKSVMKTLEAVCYPQKVREEIRGAFENLCVTSGIPQELTDSFLEEVVSDEALIQPILQMYTDETLSLPTQAWKGEFVARVEAYAATLQKKEGTKITDEELEELKASFPETADYFISEIKSSIRLSGLFSVLGSVIGMMERFLPYVMTAGLVFALFSASLLFLIWKKKIFFFSYASFVSAGILFLVPSLLYRAGNYTERLSVEPVYLKQLICTILDGFFQNMFIAGIVLCIIGILFGSRPLYLFAKNWKEKAKKEKPEEIS